MVHLVSWHGILQDRDRVTIHCGFAEKVCAPGWPGAPVALVVSDTLALRDGHHKMLL